MRHAQHIKNRSTLYKEPARYSVDKTTMSNDITTITPTTEIVVPESKFTPIVAEAKEKIAKANILARLDLEKVQPTEAQVAEAKELSKSLAKTRTNLEKTRKEVKQVHWDRGVAVDNLAKEVGAPILKLEAKMDAIAEYFERKEAARITGLKTARETEMRQYTSTPELYTVEKMAEDEYKNLLVGLKLSFEARQAAAKAEAERIANLNAENARLKAAADAAAKTAADAQAELNRVENARLETLRIAVADKRKANRAPDKEKVEAFLQAVEALELPNLKTDDGKEVLKGLTKAKACFIAAIKSQLEDL